MSRGRLSDTVTLHDKFKPYDRYAHLEGNLRKTFGRDTNIRSDAVDDHRRSLDHSTTSIPYSIYGKGELINQRVAYALATYNDPIKKVLPVSMKQDQKVVVRKKFVVGGGTTITPEHAPARIVSLREEEVEFVQVRFGCAVTFNLNEFLLASNQGQADFNQKVEAQVASMQQQWNRLAYEQLMTRGVKMTEQLARCSVSSTETSPKERAKFADETYTHAVFGAFNKYVDPISNLLLQAQQANGFDNIAYDMLLVGAGALGAEKYTRECSTRFSITGIPTKDRAPLTVALEDIKSDPRTNLMIGIVQPFPESASASTPYAVANGGGLTSEVNVGTYYVFPTEGTYRIPNMGGHSWTVIVIPTPNNGAKAVPKVAMRTQRCVMTSAILCKTGSDTGEMFFGYPSTHITMTPNTEFGQMDLRTYFGAALYEPKHAMILEDVQCNRVLSSERKAFENHTEAALNGAVDITDTDTTDNIADHPELLTGPVHYKAEKNTTTIKKLADILKTGLHWNIENDAPTLYPGRIDKLTPSGGWAQFQANEGHLGVLEDPTNPAAYGHYVHNGNVKG